MDSCNTYQFRIIQEKIETIKLQKRVSFELETPFEDISCPHCNSIYFQRWAKRNHMQRYRCKSCKRTFNSLTGTPLARLKRKEHWLDYANCIKNSLTIRAAAVECGISIDTSFRWRHRFLSNTKKIKASSLYGVVEVDEFGMLLTPIVLLNRAKEGDILYYLPQTII